jgi:hypothetical protein
MSNIPCLLRSDFHPAVASVASVANVASGVPAGFVRGSFGVRFVYGQVGFR